MPTNSINTGMQTALAPCQKPNTTPTPKTPKKVLGGKKGVLLLALATLAAGGMYLVNKSTKQAKGIGCAYRCYVPEERQGSFGQDLFNPSDSRNNDDPNSPYYHRKGAYGQDIYDANNPYNKQDPSSPYYDPNNGKC